MTTDWSWASRDIGATVKRLREQRGWKVVNLADRTKVSGAPIHRVALKKLEDGQRDYVTVAELTGLAAALGVPPLSLLVPNALGQVEVLPGKSILGLEALGWLIGAGGNVGAIQDFAFTPEDVEVDGSMRIPLRLIQLSIDLVQRRHSLLQSETFQPAANNDRMRESMAESAERDKRAIEAIESERDRLIAEYRKALPDA